jgi:ubiquinol oxidase
MIVEAENERMHLFTWMRLIRPSLFDRALVYSVQALFFNSYFFIYLFFPRTAHRFVGYLEEEAVKSYTAFIEEIDSGRIENVPAPGTVFTQLLGSSLRSTSNNNDDD